MLATITAIGIGTFIHVLAVVLAFGPTFGYGIFIAVAEQSSPRSVPAVLRGIQQTDRFLVQPGLIVVLVAGIYLLTKLDIPVEETWISVGFVAIIVLFGMSHAFFGPNVKKALGLAERDLQGGDTLSEEYAAVSRKLATGGKITGLIVAVTIFFMVVRP
ncbi:MAG: DUF2269 family protein [Solirubrobacterales bacterium]